MVRRTPFTAKDLLFTYNYITNPDVDSASIGPYKTINKVVVVDDYTVQITFKDVNPAWALPFVGVQGMTLPEHVFAPYNNSDAATAPVNPAPVGTGPYRLKEFHTEDVLVIGEDVVNTVKAVFEHNPYYRDAGKLSFDEVTLQGGGDASVAANAVLKEGVVDYAWNLQVDDSVLKALETDGVGKATVSWGSYVERIMLNFTDPSRETTEGERSSLQRSHPALSDRNVRTALALAIDRQKIAATTRAAGLLGTEHGYVYLVDEAGRSSSAGRRRRLHGTGRRPAAEKQGGRGRYGLAHLSSTNTRRGRGGRLPLPSST